MENTAVAIATPQPPFYLYRQAQPPFNFYYFDMFLNDYDDRKAPTVKGYRNCIKQFATWLKDNGITQPARDDVKAYKDHLAAAGYTAGTQAQYLRAVKAFFKWASIRGLYPNISDDLRGAKIRHDVHKKDALGRGDVAKIADTIDRSTETGRRDYAIYLICISCGLRCVEIHRADVGDIRAAGDKVYLYVQGKGHDEKDTAVELVPDVQAALYDYLATRTEKPTPKSPLFTSTSNRSKGGRIAATTISTMIKRVLVNAGYNSDRLTAHSLRHTSATGCYRATGDIYLTKDQCRHADISTTQIYAHELEREERHTEKIVYDYYFKPDDQKSDREKADEIIAGLSPDKLTQALAFLQAIK